jgi:glycosyltransferase involved in cell wall biosynthesis
MYRDHTVGVVVPAYNEEGFVGDVVRELPDFVDAVFLVDDASTDGTRAEMREVMRDRSRQGAGVPTPESVPARFEKPLSERVADAETIGRAIRLRHDRNRGAGGAVKTGYLAALQSGVDVIATIDGDSQMDSDRLPAVLDPLVAGEAGYAKGDRFADGRSLREMPTFRLVGNVLLTGLTRIASGYWRLSDPQNGYTAVTREALAAIDVEGLWEYYGYMNHLMAQLNAAGVRIADVPMPVTYGDEESGIVYSQYIRRVSLLLLGTFLWRIWTKYARPYPRPAFVGYVGCLLGGVDAVRRLATRHSDGGSPRAAATTAAVAVVGFVVAALFDRASDPTAVSWEAPRPERKPRLLEGSDDD